MPANEKRRYVMTSDLRQYIAEYTVANFWRYPIRRRVTYASALELSVSVYVVVLDVHLSIYKFCTISGIQLKFYRCINVGKLSYEIIINQYWANFNNYVPALWCRYQWRQHDSFFGFGFSFGVTLSWLHNILWTSGWILTKFSWIYNWDITKNRVDFGDDLIFKVTAVAKLKIHGGGHLFSMKTFTSYFWGYGPW